MDINDLIYGSDRSHGTCNSASQCARCENCPYNQNPPDPDDCKYYADID